MDVTPRVCLLGVIDEVMRIALERPIAAGGVGRETTARVDRDGGRLVHGLDGKVTRRLHHNAPPPADPGDDGRAVLVIMAPAGFALLAAPTCAASQYLLPAGCRL